MIYPSYSLHHIHEADAPGFDPKDYSHFKFGDVHLAKGFAQNLFEGFIQTWGDAILATEQDVVILPSPYLSIPTASNALCAYFKHALNVFLFEHGRKAAAESKIYRHQTYTTDYGALDFEQRLALIANDTYYIDRNFLDQKFCIFVDDIKITGSHEHTVNKILDQYQVDTQAVFVYFAELKNKAIHPNIENHYNYFAVKNIQDIIALANGPHFAYNTRVVKYILSQRPEDFQDFLAETQRQQWLDLFHLAIGNNYHQIEKYQTNINLLKTFYHGN